MLYHLQIRHWRLPEPALIRPRPAAALAYLANPGEEGWNRRRQSRKRNIKMGMGNKLRNRMRVAKGRANVTIGRATGDPSRQAKGHTQRMSGVVGQIGERIRDAGKDIRDSLR